ncbi:Translation machinery-associated protein 22 [Coemansia sp. RSA 2711]|nr:Translation machinery-associated protein 22 [Coemansia sp. RSA 2711]KAJ2358517.1 Translation machinery-associated protein 22 [Coemansia sp. RSA 2610]KAJ2363639.1 Translation machinery-associated protein 22 [Coemansia sp. RSA 2611]
MSEQADTRTVLYCAVCSLPPEYCEFSPSRKKCEQWLQGAHPGEHERLYGDQAIAQKMAMTSLSEEKEAKEAAKMEKAEQKSEARMARDMEKKKASKVVIKRIERSKRKSVTTVFGLDVFGIDLKSTAKMFASHFACGGSVAKNPQGLDEIVVQGDFTHEIQDIILAKFPKVPRENVEIGAEEKKKKKE